MSESYFFRIRHVMANGGSDSYVVKVRTRNQLRQEIAELAAVRQTETTVGLSSRAISNLVRMAWTSRGLLNALPNVLAFREAKRFRSDKIFVGPTTQQQFEAWEAVQCT